MTFSNVSFYSYYEFFLVKLIEQLPFLAVEGLEDGRDGLSQQPDPYLSETVV